MNRCVRARPRATRELLDEGAVPRLMALVGGGVKEANEALAALESMVLCCGRGEKQAVQKAVRRLPRGVTQLIAALRGETGAAASGAVTALMFSGGGPCTWGTQKEFVESGVVEALADLVRSSTDPATTTAAAAALKMVGGRVSKYLVAGVGTRLRRVRERAEANLCVLDEALAALGAAP